MQIPTRLAIVAAIFTLCGLLAIWSVIDAITNGRLNINLAVFWLPVGIGLFRGKESSRKWANFWFILGYILSTVFLLIALIAPGELKANIAGSSVTGIRALPTLFLGYVVTITITYLMQRAANSQPSSAYFEHKAKPCDNATSRSA